MAQNPRVLSVTELPTSEARWITLNKIKYADAEGVERLWESAQRTTRRGSIDAVAVLAILRSKTDAFPLSTVIIEQYRPPIDKFIIELPAGLIDAGETPENAAIRELKEETGFVADRVIQSSPVVVSDPGMTNANMKLVVLNVTLDDKLETPEQKLDTGEFIVTRVVELAKLEEILEEYDTKASTSLTLGGFVVDARLSHFAIGYQAALKVANGTF
ncbi:hypothetical protein BDN72DRAFT_814399 [Pluteus cervinus]|uniref:Uncharacterized protein n=1 Tax=Pluteus cervinus TaxID=181527 RepID=A0ACD3B6L9_9AGAR|nr:hypothetical protein BDN72DRAFT_814399 [Pluteus cervinus]